MSLVDVRFGLVELLTSNASIQSIVAGRIYPIKLKQGETRDSIVYHRITETEGYTYQSSDGLVNARYQFDCLSLSADKATLLANLVKEQFGGYTGRIAFDPPAPLNYVDVQLIEVATGRDEYDNEALMYLVSKDYFVIYEERNG